MKAVNFAFPNIVCTSQDKTVDQSASSTHGRRVPVKKVTLADQGDRSPEGTFLVSIHVCVCVCVGGGSLKVVNVTCV